MQHKKFEYDKESHKKIIYNKTMVLYIKMMKYTKNDEHAKNLHDKDEHENTRKMMSMKIIYMRIWKIRWNAEEAPRCMNRLWFMEEAWNPYDSWKKLEIEDWNTYIGHENKRRKMNMKKMNIKKKNMKKCEHEKLRRQINIRKNLLYLWTTYYSWKKL